MIITTGQFFRLIGIQRVLIRHHLDEVILAMHLFRPIRFVQYLLPWNWSRRPREPRAQRILHVLEELGPIFVKFGQTLSTRRDLVPDEIADELAKLQDRVASFPGAIARKIVEEAYGHPVDKVFRTFNETPLASASIAQVHAAELLDGRQVVVKVVRPTIRKTIERDIGLLYILAEFAERYWAEGRRLRPTRVVAEYEKIILDELDLVREASNASQLRRNFEGSDIIYVPQIEWDLTRENVLVMERVSGIPIDDIDSLRKAGLDLKQIAETGVELFFTQVFRDRFFHADMHPGNLFVAPPSDGQQPLRIIPVDFGIMGSLSEFDQRYLADNFLAFLKRDYRRVATLHVESGWVPPGTRVDDFEFAIRSVCEPMFERSITEISFGHLLLRLFQTAQRFHMEVLPQLMLLQKTIVNIEGVGRRLYPQLDLWRHAKPSLELWMKERVGVRKFAHNTRENMPSWVQRLPDLPTKALDLLEQTRAGDLKVSLKSEELKLLRQELQRINQRIVFAIIGAAFIISAALLSGLDGHAPMVFLHGAPLSVWLFSFTGILFIVSALLL